MDHLGLKCFHSDVNGAATSKIKTRSPIYFILSGGFNAYMYLKQIKAILTTAKKYCIFSLVTNTIYMTLYNFSL